MTLGELATRLRAMASATANRLTIDDALLGRTDQDALFRSALARAAGNLLVDIDPTTLPASDPPTSGFTIAGWLPSIAADGFLGLTDRVVALTFTQPSAAIELVVEVHLTSARSAAGNIPAAWTLSASFPALTGSPLDALAFSDPRFLYYSDTPPPPTGGFSRGAPTAGLNLGAALALDGPLGDLQALLTATKATPAAALVARGSVAPVGDSATIDLAADLGIASLSIGPFTILDVFAGIAVRAVPASGGGTQLVDYLYAGADFEVKDRAGQSIVLDVLALFATQPGAPTVELRILPSPGAQVSTTLENLASVLSADAWSDILQGPAAELKSYLDAIALKQIAATISLQDGSIASIDLVVGTLQPFSIIDPIQVNYFDVRVLIIPTSGKPITTANVDGELQLFRDDPKLLFDLDIQIPDVTLSARLSSTPDTNVATYLDRIATELSTKHIPGPIHDLLADFSLAELAVFYQKADGALGFECAGALRLADVTVDFTVLVNLAKAGSGYDAKLTGVLGVAGSTLTVTFDEQKSGFTAVWENPDNPLDISAIVEALGFTMPDIPAGLDLAVKQITLTYDGQAKTFVASADSAHYGELVFITTVDGGARTYVLALDLSTTFSLADIPLIGSKIPDGRSFGLSGVDVVVSSAPLTLSVVRAINAGLPPNVKALPDTALGAGLLIAATLTLGDSSNVLQWAFGGQPPPSANTDARALARAAAPGGDPTVWISIQRSFGPVAFQRLGLSFGGDGIGVTLVASVSLAGMTVSLEGLGITVPLSPPITPQLRLDGLGLTYSGGPVELSGAFIRRTLADNTVEYAGEALVKAAAFSLSAIGAYTTTAHPSLFIFALLDAPLGGPSFFFVTGLAAGFGYNRNLILPTLDALPSFPLVAGAMAGAGGNNPFAGKGNDPAAALQVLDDYLSPSTGEDWLAAGVRFTSFELLQSFALLSVAFGTRFEVALLGLSALSVPPAEPEPIGFAELALEVTFAPDTGLLAAAAALTPQSFILSRDCHLTGGFAFSFWFKDTTDGATANEFVVTLGGYHPHFAKPAHYPSPARLGANWQVNRNLGLKGGLYFALTPSVLMAGGAIEASWHSGDLRAWFTADANFLLGWKPFHYDATFDISLGASYKLNLLVSTETISVHVGVSVHLWGPTFAGTARVDLHVVTFTISFNTSAPKPNPIPWSEFKSSFLPKAPYCGIDIGDGLVKDLTRTPGSTLDWVVDAERLVLTTNCLIPTKSARLITAAGTKSLALDGAGATQAFGVGPVGIDDASFASDHAIAIDKISNGGPDPNDDLGRRFVSSARLGNVARAPWSRAVALSPTIAGVNRVPSTIGDALAGYSLTPVAPTPDHTPLAIALAPLLVDREATQPTFVWTTPVVATTDSFDQATAMSQLMSSIADPGVDRRRGDILDALIAQGLRVASSVDVSALHTGADATLDSPPLLSCLGEKRAATSLMTE